MKLAINALLMVWLCFSSLGWAAGVEWIVGSPIEKGTSAKHTAIGNQTDQFATVEMALKKLVEIRTTFGSAALPEGLSIRLLQGKHRLSAAIVLGTQISDSKSPVTIAGPNDKSAIITGGRVLDGWRAVEAPEILARLPAGARQQIVQFNLRSAGITDYGTPIRRGYGKDPGAVGQAELFFLGKPMPLARWPNNGYAKLRALPKGIGVETSFSAPGANVSQLAREKDLIATGYWGKDWADETIPVAAVRVEGSVIEFQPPGPKLGIADGQRYFLQNALCELDAPGEWYLDRASGILYFWPPEPIKEGSVELSVLPNLVVVNGASSLSLEGITFEMSRGDAIAINGGRNVQVRDSTIRYIGGRAATAGGEANKFVNIDVYDVGEGGIYVWGGDRGTLRSANLAVENSRIRRFNRLSRTYRPAIQLGGVGNRAVGNVISDGTHSAILFYGNNHLISYNEISNVVRETGDAGAIYSGMDWTARGTVISNNYLHDIYGPGLHGSRGVYLDDQISGITVKKNLFVNVDRAIFVGGGRDNRIEDNLMVSSSPAIHMDARGLTWQRAQTIDEQGKLRNGLRQVPFDRPPYSIQYPTLPRILEDDPGAPKNNLIRNNVVVDGKALDIEEGAQRWLSGEAVINRGDIRLPRHTGATRGDRATDFAIEPTYGGAGRGASDLPLTAMDCVADRWRSMDSGRPPITCVLDR